jgi:cellulose synthase operon protein B
MDILGLTNQKRSITNIDDHFSSILIICSTALSRGENAVTVHKSSSRGLLIGGCIFLVWLCSYLPSSSADGAEITPLSALGYTRPIMLKGVNPEFTVSIPVPTGGLDDKASSVRLHLEPAPLLSDDASVRILLHGAPLKVVTVKSLRTHPVLDLPIPPLPPGESFIHLSIQAHLYISRNWCTDLSTGNLFLTLGHQSFFHIVPRVSDHSILDFFRPFYGQVAFRVPVGLNQQQLEAAFWLYSTLAYQFRDRPTRILWQQGDDPADRSAVQVILNTRNEGPEIVRQGEQLLVSATHEAVGMLSAALATRGANYQPALLSHSLRVEAIETAAATAAASTHTFQALGFSDRPVQSFGTHWFRLPFTLAQLGGRPKDLAVRLKATFTPVNGAQGERLSAQVYFNHTLVQTYNLTDKTRLRETLSLPLTQLWRNNHLEILFSHDPAEQECQVGFPGFTAQIHGDSLLTWNGYQGPTGDFDDLPHIFLAPGQVIVDSQQPVSLVAAASLLGLISRLGRQAIQPDVVVAEGNGDWSSLPKNRQGQLPAWRLFVSAPGRTSFPAPVRLGESLEIFNPLNQRRLLKAYPSDPLGVLQYFVYQGIPTLWLSWWGAGADLAAELAQALANPSSLLASQLSGNVITASSTQHLERVTPPGTRGGDGEPGNNLVTGPRIQMWNLGGHSLRVAYPDDLDWQWLARRYRSLLIALAVLVGGVLAWRLYARLGRPPTAGPTSSAQPGGGETS